MKKAVVFLSTSIPHYLSVEFGKELQNSFDVHYVIDSDDFHSLRRQRWRANTSIIQISDKVAKEAGYYGSVVYFMRRACAKDKALYFLTNIAPKYELVWLIEDDVLIPSSTTLNHLDKKYPNADLIVPPYSIVQSSSETNDWHWPKIRHLIAFPFPWAHGMTCAVRFSKNFIQHLAEYVHREKKLFHDEAVFTTLAIHTNLTIETPPAMHYILYQAKEPFKAVDAMHLYHPVKNLSIQADWHLALKNHTSPPLHYHTQQLQEGPIFIVARAELSEWESWVPMTVLIAAVIVSLVGALARCITARLTIASETTTKVSTPPPSPHVAHECEA